MLLSNVGTFVAGGSVAGLLLGSDRANDVATKDSRYLV
jgi:hypothetical protein